MFKIFTRERWARALRRTKRRKVFVFSDSGDTHEGALLLTSKADEETIQDMKAYLEANCSDFPLWTLRYGDCESCQK